MLLAAFVRVRLADVPLERDEGEYAYAGQLILDGIPPYQQAYNMKFPGTYYACALSMALFGETTRGVRLGLLLLNAATTLLVFVIGRRLCGATAGAMAAIVFALLSLDPWLMGIFAHATHFVLLPALGGLYLVIRAPGQRRAWWLLAGGALLGLAVLMKQHAFTFLLLGAVLLLWGGAGPERRGARAVTLDLGVLALGAALPLALLCAVFLAQGVLGRFWFWAFQYAREYVSEVPPREFFSRLVGGFRLATHATPLLWVTGCAGLIALWAGRWGRAEKVFVAGLLVASFLAVCPGFYFREHYFILMLPAVALLNGVAFVTAGRLLERALPRPLARAVAGAFFGGVILAFVGVESDVLFAMGPRDVSRARYEENPFVEAVEVARYIRERTTQEDRIAVLGSEPEIYFYSHRLSATGYIYIYPLIEPQKYAARMQEEMIREITAAHPRYLVFVQIRNSWGLKPESDQRIVDWSLLYTGRCYDLVGVVDIFSRDQTRYLWDAEVAGYKPASTNLVFVYRRRSDAPCVAGP